MAEEPETPPAHLAMPGDFTGEDRLVYAFPALQIPSGAGRARPHFWQVRVRLLRGEEPVPFEDWMLRKPAPALEGLRGEITTRSWYEDGEDRRGGKPTHIDRGKNLGRRNATNAALQALLEAESRYRRYLRTHAAFEAAAEGSEVSHKARRPPEAARDAKSIPREAPPVDGAAHRASTEGVSPKEPRQLPMLVQKLGGSRKATLTDEDFERGVWVQRKYNGVRVVACRRAREDVPATREASERVTEEDVIFYSRTGAEYPGLKRLRRGVACLLAAAARLPKKRTRSAGASIPSEPYFDGELYLHGKSLSWISGQGRREDDEGLLELHLFDCFFPAAKARGEDTLWEDRERLLRAIYREASEAGRGSGALAPIRLAESYRVCGPGGGSPAPKGPCGLEAVLELCAGFVAEGYEGGIARKNAPYQYGTGGYHSANLVKIKPLHSAEYRVVGFTQGTRGKDVGALIWQCEVAEADAVIPSDRLFTVVPKDTTYEERYRLYRCLLELVPAADEPDKMVTRFERDVRGLPLTVEFPELSKKTGKPIQAKAVAFRVYDEQGALWDPLADCRSPPQNPEIRAKKGPGAPD